ncbi:5-formyltetrahydrofolate cyclo-ligase [Halobacteriales archaeon Cl-PHB]
MDKAAIREQIWDDLEASGEARFPFPPHGRIPNFAGAETAAERLAAQPEFRDAAVVKINPDSPQRSVRRLALEAGKTLYMAVPRLSEEDCFLELDPDRIDDVDDATTIAGASDAGVQVPPDDVAPVDLVISGSVAVAESGARIGKGEGYSDLEYAVLRELSLVDADTPVATTVHERQVLADGPPTAAHDVPMDLVVTPDRVLRPDTGSKPAGIDWDLLSEERVAEIPVLDRFRL